MNRVRCFEGGRVVSIVLLRETDQPLVQLSQVFAGWRWRGGREDEDYMEFSELEGYRFSGLLVLQSEVEVIQEGD